MLFSICRHHQVCENPQILWTTLHTLFFATSHSRKHFWHPFYATWNSSDEQWLKYPDRLKSSYRCKYLIKVNSFHLSASLFNKSLFISSNCSTLIRLVFEDPFSANSIDSFKSRTLSHTSLWTNWWSFSCIELVQSASLELHQFS